MTFCNVDIIILVVYFNKFYKNIFHIDEDRQTFIYFYLIKKKYFRSQRKIYVSQLPKYNCFYECIRQVKLSSGAREEVFTLKVGSKTHLFLTAIDQITSILILLL